MIAEMVTSESTNLLTMLITFDVTIPPVKIFFGTLLTQPPNGTELTCGGEAPQERNQVRAWYVQSDSSWLFRACKIVDGWFRQVERVVMPLHG